MMILLRHDDLAQYDLPNYSHGYCQLISPRIVIHTANMIPGDWANMCQAVWRSPLLPLQSTPAPKSPGTYGTGTRFKRDLLAYLNAYGRARTGPLVKQLTQFDFQAVRAALIASVPSKKKVNAMNSEKETLWGWPVLRDVVRHVPLRHCGTSHIITQVCSNQLSLRGSY